MVVGLFGAAVVHLARNSDHRPPTNAPLHHSPLPAESQRKTRPRTWEDRIDSVKKLTTHYRQYSVVHCGLTRLCHFDYALPSRLHAISYIRSRVKQHSRPSLARARNAGVHCTTSTFMQLTHHTATTMVNLPHHIQRRHQHLNRCQSRKIKMKWSCTFHTSIITWTYPLYSLPVPRASFQYFLSSMRSRSKQPSTDHNLPSNRRCVRPPEHDHVHGHPRS
jgi:hypothetical protein